MKNIKNLKKKIFGITLVVGLLVLSIVGTTMAYFTDTDTKTNVFTSGNVEIKLNSDVFLADVGKVYPGQNIAKGASVDNIGSEKAYVGVVITFNSEVNTTDITALFKDGEGSTLGGDGFTVSYLQNRDKLQAIYVVYNSILTPEAAPVQFFGTMNVPADWDNNAETNTKMSMFNVSQAEGLEMTVKAYAVQSFGLEEGGAVAALKTAFPTVWAAMPTGN